MREPSNRPIRVVPVTAAQIADARALGFILVRDADGGIWFMNIRDYAAMVRAWRLEVQ